MREHGYTCLALGQHLDDVVESFVMSAWHNGALRTMKVCCSVLQCVLQCGVVRDERMAQWCAAHYEVVCRLACCTCVAVYYTCVAVCCIVLQCVAMCVPVWIYLS